MTATLPDTARSPPQGSLPPFFVAAESVKLIQKAIVLLK